MILIKTSIFTKYIYDYLTEDEYREVQNFLVEAPESGVIIQGSGGLRKLRWRYGKKGKRCGVRIIYYWKVDADQIYLMTIYAKAEIADLSVKEKKLLKQMIEGF